MGAGRMGMTWFPPAIQSPVGYRPRHRSARRSDMSGALGRDDRLSVAAEPWGRPARLAITAGPPAAGREIALRRSFGRMTPDEIRHVLEGCALDNLSRIVPELVQLIAHSSH